MARRTMMAILLLLGLVAGLAPMGAPVMAQGEGTVVAEGLNSPMGIYVADDGSIWVVEAGLGGDETMEIEGPGGEVVTATMGETARVVQIAPDGEQTVVATTPSIFSGEESVGLNRIEVLDGEVYVTSGLGPLPEEPIENMAAVLRIGEDGSIDQVAPTWRIERRMNPDNTLADSNPYGLRADPEGRLWVADAGGNTLLRIDPEAGTIELVATFQPIEGVFPNPNRGGEMLADPVPTGLDFDDDGNALVAFLSGAPFVPGSAKVVKVTPRGAISDYATGLTMLTDLRRGPNGNFYGVQFAVFTDQGPTPNSGALVRIEEGEGSTPVVEGLSFPTAVDFDDDGNAYVTINGVGAPGSGAVVMFEGVAGAEAAAQATPEPEEEAQPSTPAPDADAPSVAVSDQETDGTSITVDSVVAEQPGWMVIHADADGKPGGVLGQTPVAPGTTENVIVILDEPIAGETALWAMLHVDEGQRGTYEFPGGPDVPVQVDGSNVMAPFTATAPDGEADMGDIVDTAASNDQFSTLVAALQAAGLVDALKGEGPFTVFAPTNDAFDALPEGTLEALLADPAGDLTQILLYHVVPGRVLAADVTDGLVADTVQGGQLEFSVDGDQVMVNDANIIATDIEASNGVIHVIDSVLMPPSEEEAAEATPEPAEEATPEPAEEATPEPVEEATPTPVAEEEATPAAEEEATATPVPEEEAGGTGGKGGAPGTMPDTGAAQTGAGMPIAVVAVVMLALAGSVVVWRRRTF